MHSHLFHVSNVASVVMTFLLCSFSGNGHMPASGMDSGYKVQDIMASNNQNAEK